MTVTAVSGTPREAIWPALPSEEWKDTRETLHMWMQIVGKVRLALAPMLNHWWQVPLYVTARGLSTSAIPVATRAIEFEFDFHDHVLRVETSDGDVRRLALAPRSVADFYREFMQTLSAIRCDVRIRPVPVEVERAIPFDEDHEHASYDAEAVHRFWRVILQTDRVLKQFRARFIGKVSPVHFFWGGFDLAVTRFSGRAAPAHPGGIPNVGDWVMREAYSHEVSSCGWWPAGGSAPDAMFYAYAYPEPAGFPEAAVRPKEAFYSTEMREFFLPYGAVRSAGDPDGALLDFFQTTYEAAAELGKWDRGALERR